jgi:nucleoside-diphosphate-sugar epimerase
MIGITGSSGVLGSLLILKLEKNNEKFSRFRGDIRDFYSVCDWIKKENINVIYHFAAIVPVNEVEKDISTAYDVNINGTIQILKAIADIKKEIYFFYASTSHVYKSYNRPIREEDKKIPQNTYGLTKLISEQILDDFAKKSNNFKLCIGRIFSFYHFSQSPPFLYPTMISRFKSEDLSKPFKIHNGNSVRDFLNAEEVIEIIYNLVKSEYSGTINIASGRPITILEFVNKIAPSQLHFENVENGSPNMLVANISKLKSVIYEY